MNSANNLILDVLYIFIIGFIPVLINIVKTIASYTTKYLAEKTKNEELKNVLESITKFAEEAVTCTMQTYVDTVKSKGAFTPEAQEEAFNLALEETKKFISLEYRDLFESAYGSLEDYLRVLIEAKVKELKLKEEKTAPKKTATKKAVAASSK